MSNQITQGSCSCAASDPAGVGGAFEEADDADTAGLQITPENQEFTELWLPCVLSGAECSVYALSVL